MKKILICLLVMIALLSPIIFAEEELKTESVQSVTAAQNAAAVNTDKAPPATIAEYKSGPCLSCAPEKFGRGLSNALYSPLEIPYRVGKEMERLNPIAAFGSGLIKGTLWFGLRLAVGAFDTVTFFVPTDPIMPDFDAGWWTA